MRPKKKKKHNDNTEGKDQQQNITLKKNKKTKHPPHTRASAATGAASSRISAAYMPSQLLWKCGGGGATHSYTYGSPGGTRYRLHKARPFERVLAGATNGDGNFIFHHTAGVVFLLCKSKQQFLVDLLVVISSF